MLVTLSLLCLASQATETTLEDGRRVVAETRLGEDGARIRHGDFDVFAPTGVRLVSGEYDEGLRTGRWLYRHRNEQRAAVGKFRDGVRAGTWETFWPDGTKRAKGKFKDGLPTGRWVFYDRFGEVNTDAGGEFEIVQGEAPHTGYGYTGYLREGAIHGWWCVERVDGSRVFEGAYRNGEPAGQSRFSHVGGVSDDVFFRGANDPSYEPCRVFRTPDPYGDLVALDPVAVEPPDVPDLRAAVALIARQPLIAEHAKTEIVALAGTGRSALTPAALRAVGAACIARLVAVDRDDKAQREEALKLVKASLEPALGYPALG